MFSRSSIIIVLHYPSLLHIEAVAIGATFCPLNKFEEAKNIFGNLPVVLTKHRLHKLAPKKKGKPCSRARLVQLNRGRRRIQLMSQALQKRNDKNLVSFCSERVTLKNARVKTNESFFKCVPINAKIFKFSKKNMTHRSALFCFNLNRPISNKVRLLLLSKFSKG